MVTSVSPADSGWVNSTITHSSESICAGPNARSDCVHRVPSERLEVKPQLTDVVRAFVDIEDTCSSAGRRVCAGVARVPDVRRVGGDGGATGRGRYDTADSEACSTGARGGAPFGSALRRGVARAVGAGGAAADTLVIGELDHAEHAQLL